MANYSAMDLEPVHQYRELESLQYQFKTHQIILSALKSIKFKSNAHQHSDITREQLEEIIHACRLKSFLKTNNKLAEIDVFDTQLEPKTLSYIDRKFLKDCLVNQLRKTLQPSVEFKIRIFAKPKQYTPFNINVLQNDIIEMENRRNKLQLILVKLKVKRLQLLNVCVELKCNSHQETEAELMLLATQKNNLKAGIFKGMLLQEIFHRNEYALKAIQEMKSVLENELSDTKKA